MDCQLHWSIKFTGNDLQSNGVGFGMLSLTIQLMEQKLALVLGYAEFLKTPNFLLYLHFFQDIVERLQPLSFEFQKEVLLVCHIPKNVEEARAMFDVLCDVPGEAYSHLLQGLNPLVHNVPNWSNTLEKSYSICCKIFKVCLTILGHCALKG